LAKNSNILAHCEGSYFWKKYGIFIVVLVFSTTDKITGKILSSDGQPILFSVLLQYLLKTKNFEKNQQNH
jgi:hypothetical protein